MFHIWKSVPQAKGGGMETTMQNNNEILQEKIEQISEIMYKLDMSTCKVEQSAFESINVTDQLMSGLQIVFELITEVASKQEELEQALEMSSAVLNTVEGYNLIHIANHQAKNLKKLELGVHKVAQAAIEASDAARCIEAGVAEQSENIAELMECNESILGDFTE